MSEKTLWTERSHSDLGDNEIVTINTFYFLKTNNNGLLDSEGEGEGGMIW